MSLRSTHKYRKAGLKPSLRQSMTGRLRDFLHALGDRFQKILQVLDEALQSDDLKEKKWAVDVILKNVGTEKNIDPETAPPEPIREHEPAADGNPAALSDTELMARIRKHLEPPSS